MTTLIDIQNTLQSWVASQTSLTTIWSRQNAPRPEMPYCSLYILSLVRVGHDDITPPEDELGTYKIIGNSYLNLNVSIYYKKDNATIDAINLLDALRLSVRKQSVNALFNSGKLSFIRPLTSITDFSEVVATGFEQRAMLDLQFLVATYVTDTTDLIERVSGEGIVAGDKIINYEAENNG